MKGCNVARCIFLGIPVQRRTRSSIGVQLRAKAEGSFGTTRDPVSGTVYREYVFPAKRFLIRAFTEDAGLRYIEGRAPLKNQPLYGSRRATIGPKWCGGGYPDAGGTHWVKHRCARPIQGKRSATWERRHALPDTHRGSCDSCESERGVAAQEWSLVQMLSHHDDS